MVGDVTFVLFSEMKGFSFRGESSQFHDQKCVVLFWTLPRKKDAVLDPTPRSPLCRFPPTHGDVVVFSIESE